MTSGDAHPLLQLQQLDITLDQIRHRLMTLPEREAVVSADKLLAGIDAERAQIEAARRDTVREHDQREADLATLEARIDKLDKMLYGGGITSPKDAMLAQDELNSLNEQRGRLEDRILELLDQLEPSDAELESLRARRAAVIERRAADVSALAEREAEVGVERRGVEEHRLEVAAQLEAPLLTDYERLRLDLAPATVVTFDGSRCVGCPSAMPAVERDRVKRLAPGTVGHCDECGRIVIR